MTISKEEISETLFYLLKSSQEFLKIVERSGALDNVVAELFPDAEMRGGMKREDLYKEVDKARNELKSYINMSENLLNELYGEDGYANNTND